MRAILFLPLSWGHILQVNPLLYNTQTTGTACTGIPSTGNTAIDMSTAACGVGGTMQCPRCFVMTGNPAAQRTLTLTNCNAVAVYPVTTAGPYTTSTTALIEYTFVLLGTTSSWVITDTTNTFTLSGTGATKSKTVVMIVTVWATMIVVSYCRILTFDPTVATLYTGTTSATGCVRLSNVATISIDMSTAACNGFQCPRCFLYPVANTITVTLTISNCHAVLAYPQNSAGPYALNTNVLMEYVFIFEDTGSGQNFNIGNVSNGAGVTTVTLSNAARIRTMLCYQGKFYAE